MTESYDLTQLDANSFEHLVTLLAMRVLGPGHTGFGPGSDGGRDGYYEGEAPYPSEIERWSGCWYIQSKFHKPHLSKDPQKWLLDRIREELEEFKKPESKRKWPDNWIVATNIDPSGTPMTGAFDQARALVVKERPSLKDRFHIWGGRKILDLLTFHPEVTEYYRDFLTPGHILTAIYNQINDAYAEVETILRFLIVKQFGEQQFTKLEQAGSAADTRPGIHRLFIDLPFRASEYNLEGLVTVYLVRTAARCHRVDTKQPDSKEWRLWRRDPSRARVWFVKGGPGQGKSTIGQYFCQIQRASLILQEDGPSVSPQQRSLATEVKKEAEKADFWPLVPRIPIYIELKEFAQWFGQRESNSARGILTYLAERVSVGVEQQVLVGTLKRLLQNHSWFVVFDGLDEVPHDVKDKVALEVCNFVENVVIETNADVLTFCTSRPQGYSGQFSDLDGPQIDLTSLSPEKALQCAKPLLELERSEEEAKRSLQILTSAIQSSSVRELMTTPLQAHIMAVVVRDGGRPPDRRWQLFTNFYQVIRRREANRNLPDSALAKLLREEEQLLKTVHNRLGCVLHARAETSKGAQTHLERSELKTLVRDAVSQMTDREIDNTVDVLMKATTDRLVLVSTPDDGNHVRFDIRQLQEFFSAEFLYESVNADELRRRIELLAGDSHWREVMHFLLSALVENDRRTELSVAIEVLERLNEGNNGDSHTRLLNRRLGRGALLAARLLQEGVLEQDKRIRQQFRKCLEPLAAFTEVSELSALISVNQPNSRVWLFNFLIEFLQEANANESVGAAIVLAHVLPDNNERIEEFRKFLLSSPPDYISLVLNSRIPYPYIEPSIPMPKWVLDLKTTPIPRWLLDTTLELLLRPQWTSLSIKGIRSGIQILQNNIGLSFTIAKEKGLPPVHIELLRALLKPEAAPIKECPETDFGILKVGHLKHDWTTAESGLDNWTVESLGEASSATGILQLLYRVLRFGKTKRQSDLILLLDYLNEQGKSLFNTLPIDIQAYIPINVDLPLDDQINRLKSLNESQFDTLLGEQQIGFHPVCRPSSQFTIGEKCNLDQWKACLEVYPTIAFYLWSDIFWFRSSKKIRPEFLDTEEAVNSLIDKLLRHPTILREFLPLWGRLLDKAPKRQSELRQAFLIASSEPIVDKTFISREFHTFELELPSEASLLPYLIDSLIMDSQRTFRGGEASKELGKLIYKFVKNNSLLEQVANDSGLARNIRAAALIMSLLHPKRSKGLKNEQELLIKLYDPSIGSWYLRDTSFCLTQLATEENQVAKFIVGNLLDAARADYEGRNELQQLLALWREISHAPVSKAGVLKQWLSGA